MIRELLTKDAFNVISVDWVLGAAPPYTQAVANARMVGAVLAHFIERIRVSTISTHCRDAHDEICNNNVNVAPRTNTVFGADVGNRRPAN